jgi:hypothetical protein
MEPILDDLSPDKFVHLTTVEQMVYNVLSEHDGLTMGISEIAKQCRLTEVQVIVAIQLLTHKKLLPTDKILF